MPARTLIRPALEPVHGGIAVVTGSAGLLGHALCEQLKALGWRVRGIDVRKSKHTTHMGSFCDAELVEEAMEGASMLFHSGALHKPHVATHTKEQFIATNLQGTRILLAAATQPSSSIRGVMFASSTSVFGYAMKEGGGKGKQTILDPSETTDEDLLFAIAAASSVPASLSAQSTPVGTTDEDLLFAIAAASSVPASLSAQSTPVGTTPTKRVRPAVWVNESLSAIPHNIYALTKLAAEQAAAKVHRTTGMPILVLRLSRFFPEEDDELEKYSLSDENMKSNEFTFRRVHLDDAVDACVCAAASMLARPHWRASAIPNPTAAESDGFDMVIISSPTPFVPSDGEALGTDACQVLKSRLPFYESVYSELGWHFFDTLDRVYDSARAQRTLGWTPRHHFEEALAAMRVALDKPDIDSKSNRRISGDPTAVAHKKVAEVLRLLGTDSAAWQRDAGGVFRLSQVGRGEDE